MQEIFEFVLGCVKQSKDPLSDVYIVIRKRILNTTYPMSGTTLEGGLRGLYLPSKFRGSEKGTERETDNLLLIAPPESKS